MNYELKIFYTEDVTKSARLLILKNEAQELETDIVLPESFHFLSEFHFNEIKLSRFLPKYFSENNIFNDVDKIRKYNNLIGVYYIHEAYHNSYENSHLQLSLMILENTIFYQNQHLNGFKDAITLSPDIFNKIKEICENEKNKTKINAIKIPERKDFKSVTRTEVDFLSFMQLGHQIKVEQNKLDKDETTLEIIKNKKNQLEDKLSFSFLPLMAKGTPVHESSLEAIDYTMGYDVKFLDSTTDIFDFIYQETFPEFNYFLKPNFIIAWETLFNPNKSSLEEIKIIPGFEKITNYQLTLNGFHYHINFYNDDESKYFIGSIEKDFHGNLIARDSTGNKIVLNLIKKDKNKYHLNIHGMNHGRCYFDILLDENTWSGNWKIESPTVDTFGLNFVLDKDFKIYSQPPN